MRHIPLFVTLALLLTACVGNVQTQVTRFHEGNLPQGETFTMEPADPAMRGPEFRNYAALIRDELQWFGYRPVEVDPDLRVVVDYGVSEGRTRVETYGGYGHPFYGYQFGTLHPLRHSVVHPFYYDGFYGPEIVSETVYTRRLQLRIVDTDNGEVVFEGRALSEGPSGELALVMPYLVESMFRNFPGESGATKVVEIETQGGRRY